MIEGFYQMRQQRRVIYAVHDEQDVHRLEIRHAFPQKWGCRREGDPVELLDCNVIALFFDTVWPIDKVEG